MEQALMKWVPHVTVAAVITTKRDDTEKFLMVEESINAELVINQPAGHWEQDESLLEAVIRETLEETSYRVKPLHLVGIYNWTIPQNENAKSTKDTFLRFTFACEVKGKTNQTLDPDIHQFLWLSEDEIRSSVYQKRSPLVIKSLDDYLSKKHFPLSLFSEIQ